MPAIRLEEFDTWRPGYGLATVYVYKAGAAPQTATIYSDEDLQTTVSNPITLAEKTEDGISYGKLDAPVYVGEPFELQINSVDRTGIVRPPLTTLVGQDASEATVKVSGGEVDIALKDNLARRIDVRDFGEFLAVDEEDASAATNTTTLNAALGAAGARGGGYVEMPEGTYEISTVTLPQAVVLRGVARDATFLQSVEAGQVIIAGGDRAGLESLTLDGRTLVGNSVGFYAEDIDHTHLKDVLIKRFEVGLHRNGGKFANWQDFSISNCVDGYRGDGNDDEDLTAELAFDHWRGGQVDTCSSTGVRLKNDGQPCRYQVIDGVRFESNTGKALHIIGARNAVFPHCSWLDNTIDLEVEDGDPETDSNTVIGLEFPECSFKDGAINLTGNLERTAFRRSEFEDVTVTLTTPSHNVLAEDCREISGVTIAGIATAWERFKTGDRGGSSGITTGNAATKVWAITLDAGQQVYLEGRVIGRQRNGINTGFYHIAVSAGRPGASLVYDTQTVNFTVGDVLTGATSGATARITADSDGGTTGTLTLQDIVGEFLDDEIITDASGGSATCNGSLSYSNGALVGSVANLRAVQETNANWVATFVANGPQIELQVTGDASQTVEWTAHVDVKSS